MKLRVQVSLDFRVTFHGVLNVQIDPRLSSAKVISGSTGMFAAASSVAKSFRTLADSQTATVPFLGNPLRAQPAAVRSVDTSLAVRGAAPPYCSASDAMRSSEAAVRSAALFGLSDGAHAVTVVSRRPKARVFSRFMSLPLSFSPARPVIPHVDLFIAFVIQPDINRHPKIATYIHFQGAIIERLRKHVFWNIRSAF